MKRSIITVSFIDYYVNSHKIEGTKIITNNGLNAPGNFTFSVVVSKSKITSPTASFSYDANGNILNLTRNGSNSGGTMNMDNFTCRYDNANSIAIVGLSGVSITANISNKLYHVNDGVKPP